MAYDNNDKRADSVYSQRVRAGKRRTYFFDVRETRGNDYYLTITESRKKFNEDGYDRHKLFLYKEDFNKFLKGITEAIDFVKTELMPDFDFDIFSHENDDYQKPPQSSQETQTPSGIAPAATPEIEGGKDDIDKQENTAAEGAERSDSTPPGTGDSTAGDADSQDDEHVEKW